VGRTAGAFELDRVGATLVVTPLADLTELHYQAVESGAAGVLEALEDPSVRDAVVDFHRAVYLGSTALAFLARLARRVGKRGGRLALCNLSGPVGEALRAAALDRLWPAFGSKAEALAALGG
jgi:anti-anti-sigma factor